MMRAAVLIAGCATFATLGAAPLLPATAATIAPPMHDIAAQCSASTRRNVTAMSECIVAESEARAEILQRWDKLSDASVEKCLKLGSKAKSNKKYPYATLAKCVALEPVEVRTQATQAAPAAEAQPVSPSGRSLLPSWVRRWTESQKDDTAPAR